MKKPGQQEVDAELSGAYESLAEARIGVDNGLSRLAVSSAYYAVFHATRAALWSRGMDAKTHYGLSRRFHQELVRTGAIEPEYQAILDRGRDERQAASYDFISYEASRENAARYLADADRFVERMRSLINNERKKSAA